MQGISNHAPEAESLIDRTRTDWGLNRTARSKPGVKRVLETVDVDSGLRPKIIMTTKRRLVYRHGSKRG